MAVVCTLLGLSIGSVVMTTGVEDVSIISTGEATAVIVIVVTKVLLTDSSDVIMTVLVGVSTDTMLVIISVNVSTSIVVIRFISALVTSTVDIIAVGIKAVLAMFGIVVVVIALKVTFNKLTSTMLLAETLIDITSIRDTFALPFCTVVSSVN